MALQAATLNPDAKKIPTVGRTLGVGAVPRISGTPGKVPRLGMAGGRGAAGSQVEPYFKKQ